jgi:2-polyprenyl-3-methyl-5-hydroxy-6-metoxy-1,4-benzoquinol methylase
MANEIHETCPVCGQRLEAGCLCLKGYSESFQRRLHDIGADQLVAGAKMRGSFKDWEAGRQFIASAVDRDGTIFHLGCANGLLLRSLTEWSEHKLVPYGIDIDPTSVAAAKKVFEETPERFVSNDELPGAVERGDIPPVFDMVYWTVWDNEQLTTEDGKKFLDYALGLVKPGGRLILGFYNESRQRNLDQIAVVRKMGFNISSKIEHSGLHPEMIAVIDRNA